MCAGAPDSRPLTMMSPATALIFSFIYKSSAVAEMGDRLVTIGMGRKWRGGAGSPSNTIWPGPSLPSGILIHPTVWRQYTNVTDRQTRRTRR